MQTALPFAGMELGTEREWQGGHSGWAAGCGMNVLCKQEDLMAVRHLSAVQHLSLLLQRGSLQSAGFDGKPSLTCYCGSQRRPHSLFTLGKWSTHRYPRHGQIEVVTRKQTFEQVKQEQAVSSALAAAPSSSGFIWPLLQGDPASLGVCPHS